MVSRLLTAAVVSTIAAAPVAAQELRIALNALDPQPEACRLTFVAENDLGSDIGQLVVEAVLFNTAGRVAQFTLFDFAALPPSRQRVRQFDVAGLGCADVAQVLFNGVTTCEGAEPAACAAALRPSSAVEGVEVAG